MHGSEREGIVSAAVDEFKEDLAEYWSKNEVMHPMPNLRITVERKPLKSFPLFPRLPVEFQLAIWDFAARAPQLLELQWDASSRVELSATNS